MGVLNSFYPGLGNSPIKKIVRGFARGDGQAWNLLIHNSAINEKTLTRISAVAHAQLHQLYLYLYLDKQKTIFFHADVVFS